MEKYYKNNQRQIPVILLEQVTCSHKKLVPIKKYIKTGPSTKFYADNTK